MKSTCLVGDWTSTQCTVSLLFQLFYNARMDLSHCFFSGVYGRSPHVDLPLLASVGAVDESERGQSEEEGSEDGRLYNEI